MTTERCDDETERAWDELQARVARWLSDEPDDQHVLIELAWPDDEDEGCAAPYVQLAIDEGLVRAEAVSNQHLTSMFLLDDARVAMLRALGWAEPDDETPSNMWRDDALPEDAEALAEALVATLRDVYGVPAPEFLVVSGFTDAGWLDADDLPFGLPVAEPDVPPVDVTAVVASDADELRDLVAETVASVVGDEVEFDPDGDIPVPAGGTVVYVRVEEDGPEITLFAAVQRDVRWTPRVGHTLNEINMRIHYGRVVFHDGHVLLECRLFARPFVPELLRHAVIGMTGLVDGLDEELERRLSGRTCSDHQDGVA